MPLPRLPRLRAGQTPTAADWNALVEYLSQTEGTASGTAFGDIGAARSGGSLQVLDGRERSHWAKITSRASGTTNAYAHVQVSPDGDGTFTDLPATSDYIFGTTTNTPAREVNGRVDFDSALPIYVRLLPDYDDANSPGYLFSFPGSASGGFFARLTSSSSGKWKWYALTLDGTPAPADDGAESADYTAVPHSPFGHATPAPVAGDRVWMWPSKQAGYYEFVALETFRASGTGSSRGLVPDPGSKAGTTRVLHENATWAVATIDTTPSDKTTLDRMTAATLAVDDSGVVTVTAAKKQHHHPYTAAGVMVTAITEGDTVTSDTSITLTDTTSAFFVTDSMTGTVRVHAKTPVDPLAADYELVDAADRGRLLTFTGARTITLPDPVPDFPDGWWCRIESRDATCTLVRETAATIDGATSLTIPAGQGVFLASDGTSWYTERGLEPKASAASILVGRGSKSGAGDRQEITLDGTYLGMGSGTVLTYTPDLTPSGKADTLDVDKVTGFAVSGSNLRLTVERRTVEFVKNAALEPIDTVIGKATTVNFDVVRCDISDGCPVDVYGATGIHGFPFGGIVLGGFDGPDVDAAYGGIVLGGLTDSELCDLGPGGTEDLDGPTVDSVTGDGSSGASPYTVRFTPVVSGGIPDADGGGYTYAWTFDGSPGTSTDFAPSVTFTGAGTHSFTLVVTDDCGNVSSTFNGSVTVSTVS